MSRLSRSQGLAFGPAWLVLGLGGMFMASFVVAAEPACKPEGAPGSGTTLYDCQLLEVSAQVGGRPPFVYHWTLTEGAVVIAEADEPVFQWTAERPESPGFLFADGFESGDLSAWGTSPTSSGGAPAHLTLTLAVTNLSGAHTDRQSTPITVLPLPTLGFAAPPFSLFLDQATLDLTVQDTGSERRLVFEDPDGFFTDCPPPLTRCHRTEWTEDRSFVHTWSEPGTYAVVAEARQCGAPPVARATASVTIDTAPQDPPRVLLFDLDPGSSTGCGPLCGIFLSCTCSPGATLVFTVLAVDASHLRFDWQGDGTWDEALALTDGVAHTYAAVGTYRPRVQPYRGETFGEVVALPFEIEIRP